MVFSWARTFFDSIATTAAPIGSSLHLCSHAKGILSSLCGVAQDQSRMRGRELWGSAVEIGLSEKSMFRPTDRAWGPRAFGRPGYRGLDVFARSVTDRFSTIRPNGSPFRCSPTKCTKITRHLSPGISTTKVLGHRLDAANWPFTGLRRR